MGSRNAESSAQAILLGANAELFEGDYVLASCELFEEGRVVHSASIGAGELNWGEGGE